MAKCDICGVECVERKFPNISFCGDCRAFFFGGLTFRMNPEQSKERKDAAGNVDEKRPAWYAKVSGGTGLNEP